MRKAEGGQEPFPYKKRRPYRGRSGPKIRSSLEQGIEPSVITLDKERSRQFLAGELVEINVVAVWPPGTQIIITAWGRLVYPFTDEGYMRKVAIVREVVDKERGVIKVSRPRDYERVREEP